MFDWYNSQARPTPTTFEKRAKRALLFVERLAASPSFVGALLRLAVVAFSKAIPPVAEGVSFVSGRLFVPIVNVYAMNENTSYAAAFVSGLLKSVIVGCGTYTERFSSNIAFVSSALRVVVVPTSTNNFFPVNQSTGFVSASLV